MLPKLLAGFEPFRRLDYSALTTLARHCRILTLPAGRLLVRPGSSARGHYYLVRGRVGIESGSTARREIVALTPGAREPVQASGRIGVRIQTLTPVSVLWVDLEHVGFLLESSAQSGYEVDELEGLSGGDWLRVFIGSVIGRCLTGMEIKLLFSRCRVLPARRGQRIVSAGEPGDGFYLIEAGSASVSKDGETQAQLTAGSFFGEESLLSRQPRNADVDMTSTGRLLCFSADTFESLVRPAVLAAHRRMDGPRHAGPCIDLDRHPWRDGDMRDLAGRLLTAHTRYLLTGGTDARRCHAAYLLAGRGYDVFFDTSVTAPASPVAER
jgi:CRP-like cAMP-binding protein